MKIFIALLILIVGANGDIKKINQTINQNKTILSKTKKEEQQTNSKIRKLANELAREEDRFEALQRDLEETQKKIEQNKVQLDIAKREIDILGKKSQDIERHIAYVEEKIVNAVVDRYTITIGKDKIEKNSIKEIIEKEKFKLIFENSKDTVLKANIEYFQITNLKNDNDAKKQLLETYIKEEEARKKKVIELTKEREKKMNILKEKHSAYQKELKAILAQQNNLNSLLSKLNIVKQNELDKIRRAEMKAKQERLKKEQAGKKIDQKTQDPIAPSKDIRVASRQQFEDDIDMNVKNKADVSGMIQVGSSANIKMKPPLASYSVVKKFGPYTDPFYKIKLFNDSVHLKSKTPNEKVYSALAGQVVYAKNDAGSLGNVVILKHANNVHTIYSQLSQLAPTLQMGRVVPQGYVVGRVEDTLVFQATKNSNYLNPEELF